MTEWGLVETVLGLVELSWGWMRTSGNCLRASWVCGGWMRTTWNC